MRSLAWLSLVISLALGSQAQTVASIPQKTTVSVPALVESKSGEIAYGLSAVDFSIKDDGIEQRVRLEDIASVAPLSVFLVIQTGGRGASVELEKIARLDDLLDSILTNPRDQVAVLTFDSRPTVLHDLTSDSDAISRALASLASGDSGSALFDALHIAINSLRRSPPKNRRIIIVISGEHDHGSNASDPASLIRDISSSEISVYGLSFRAKRKELLSRLSSLNPLAMTAGAVQKNATEALAQLTGGDFYRFNTEKVFEDRVTEVASHIHNRYSLTFQPSSPQPGFHSLKVDVLSKNVSVVSARTGYWLSSSDGVVGGGKPQ